jgi:hypothetical protein
VLGAGFCCSLACNNRRSENGNDSISTDAAAEPDTAAAVREADAPYSQTLTFKQYSFVVNQEGEGSLRRLIVTGKDSVNDLDELNEPVDGSIYYAAATDINGDNKPELFLFSRGTDSAAYTKVYAYAYDGKTGRQISLPELSPDEATGYMGHDSVYIEDNYLVRQFPIYRNDSITNSMRTIRYTLKPSHGGYRFEAVQ